MLPKIVYNKVLKSLQGMRADWEKDRGELPDIVPYDIDSQLTMSIERHIQEGGVRCYGQQDRRILVEQTITYLREKGLIVKSPFGGHMFPLPKDAKPLPTKAELIQQIEDSLKGS